MLGIDNTNFVTICYERVYRIDPRLQLPLRRRLLLPLTTTSTNTTITTSMLINVYVILMVFVCTFVRLGPVAVPVVVVRGRQFVQLRLVPDEHVLGTRRPVIGTAAGRRRRRLAGTAAAAATAANAAAERRFLLFLLIVDGDVHAGHEADTGLLLLGHYHAAAAIPSSAGHQRGPPPDDGLLLPPNPSQCHIGHQPVIGVYTALSNNTRRYTVIVRLLHTDMRAHPEET